MNKLKNLFVYIFKKVQGKRKIIKIINNYNPDEVYPFLQSNKGEELIIKIIRTGNVNVS